MRQRVTLGDVADLPAVLMTNEAASLLGVSIDHLWALAREGTSPVEPLRLGRSYRWPTAPLLTLLGLGPQRAAVHCSGSDDTSIEERASAVETSIPDPECPNERDSAPVARPRRWEDHIGWAARGGRLVDQL